jgi:Tc toxin complex TcA C-terminal TcB-binding domain
MTGTRFHGYYDRTARPVADPTKPRPVTVLDRSLTYAFQLHEAPYAEALLAALERDSLDGLFALDIENETNPDRTPVALLDDNAKPVLRADGTPEFRPKLYEELFEKNQLTQAQAPYGPSPVVIHPYPVKSLDFSPGGAYATYNWELFHYIPRSIWLYQASRGLYDEARRWIARNMDLTADSGGPAPERYWKLRVFQSTDVRTMEETLVNLSTGADPDLRDQTIAGIQAWTKNPFQPYAVARMRPSEFRNRVARDFIELGFTQARALLARNSPETVAEAAQILITVANVLQTRPQAVPKKGTVQTQTYASLRGKLNAFGDALVDLEVDVPFDVAPLPPTSAADGAKLQALAGIGQTLYFCVPRNDEILAYWDELDDLLFKIHNSLNLQGVFRQLPLFPPPIDPALLARAAAAGVDVGAVVAGLNQPLPLVRSPYLFQKTFELAAEVESLNMICLSATERQNEEALSLARARNESAIVRLAIDVKYAQWQEAKKATEAMREATLSARERLVYYAQLCGQNPATLILPPLLDDLDTDALFSPDESFQSTEINEEVQAAIIPAAPDLSNVLGASDPSIVLSSNEVLELAELESAQKSHQAATLIDIGATYLSLIPQFDAEAQPLGVGAGIGFGGEQLSKVASIVATAKRGDADESTYLANAASKLAAYERRQQERVQQLTATKTELNERYKSYRVAQIHEAAAKREHEHQKTTNDLSEQILAWLGGATTIETPEGDAVTKTTGPDLYGLRLRRANACLEPAMQLVTEQARMTQHRCQYELGDPSFVYIGNDYRAGRDGLMGVKELIFDLKRMEAAYMDLNRREYELVKHVSLMQVDPAALMQLRATGRCKVTLPEEVFDLDCPGHHFRRIRSVGVTIPCVVGSYTSVNCRLTLQKSSIRATARTGDSGHARTGPDDDRFRDYPGGVEGIVTSTAQNDGGVFDPSARDERSLPFELSGAISEWQLELLSAVEQIDRMQMVDVLFRFSLSAREGGELLRAAATANLESKIAAGQAPGSVRLLSVRENFPDDWFRFTSAVLTPTAPRAPLSLTLREEHYPPWIGGRLGAVLRIDVIAESAKPELHLFDTADATGNQDTLLSDDTLGGLLAGTLAKIPLPAPLGTLALHLDDNTMKDIWILLRWGAKQGP